ncbi:hypothetical protein FTX61_12120 [Nitriliruptoraceae bacterium ZYF776]|nr:hypothetical protein [Profundirhabdus halotolerans]
MSTAGSHRPGSLLVDGVARARPRRLVAAQSTAGRPSRTLHPRVTVRKRPSRTVERPGALTPDRPRDGATVEPLLERLLNQAYLFDDPGAYEAGVRDAFAALADAAHEPDRSAANLAA